MRVVAKIISRLFDPVVVVPLILVMVVSMAYLNGYRWRLFLLLFFLDAMVPGIMAVRLFLKRRGHDWDIHDIKQRWPLFLAVCLGHGLGVITAWFLGRHPLTEILLGLWLLAVCFTLITKFWKISVHTGVNMTLVMMVALFINAHYWWLFGLVILVGWARIIDRDHTLAQVVAGALIPLVGLPVLYRVWGIL